MKAQPDKLLVPLTTGKSRDRSALAPVRPLCLARLVCVPIVARVSLLAWVYSKGVRCGDGRYRACCNAVVQAIKHLDELPGAAADRLVEGLLLSATITFVRSENEATASCYAHACR